jgi:hypothetical protein
MWYGVLADVVVAVHLAYVCFVVFGQAAILLGLCFRWRWVRNPWFRGVHLLLIGIVAAEAILDMTCPLTLWEYRLRDLAGQETSEASFVGRLLRRLFFFDWPPWVFTCLYVGFALVVLATFVLAPPRGFRRAREGGANSRGNFGKGEAGLPPFEPKKPILPGSGSP